MSMWRTRDEAHRPVTASTRLIATSNHETVFARLSWNFQFFLWAAGLGIRGLSGPGELSLARRMGRVVNPVRSYSRFSEFLAADTLFRSVGARDVLDIGSPKLFSLWLARQHAASFLLTDIWERAAFEYRDSAERMGLGGKVRFATQDGTQLDLEDESFDMVLAISVLEHVPSRGDAQAVNEVCRVLKKGGHFLFSVPFGRRFVEQSRRRFSYSDSVAKSPSFFQRIYNCERIRQLVEAAPFELVDSFTITHPMQLRLWRSLPIHVKRLLGPISPIIGALRGIEAGHGSAPQGTYSSAYKSRQISGDFVGILRKLA